VIRVLLAVPKLRPLKRTQPTSTYCPVPPLIDKNPFVLLMASPLVPLAALVCVGNAAC
jgi:hypothetical protein